MKFYIVDDNQALLKLMESLIKKAGFEVKFNLSSEAAVPEILEWQPDCVLVDIMMPKMNGFDMMRKLHAHPEGKNLNVVIVSGKTFDYDRRRAIKYGAKGYITKPINSKTFVPDILKYICKDMTIDFWGVRGTLPVPGEGALRYGGNTSCITLSFTNDMTFIFDAGTGIKKLSNHLVARGAKRMDAKIFISHPHWDHINALPFFVPLYATGNVFEILGAAHEEKTMEQLMSAQMEDIYFPITMREFGSRISFRDLDEEELDFGDIHVKTMLLSHPGHCLGYRVEYDGKVFCYVTDNEIFPEETGMRSDEYVTKLTEFVKDADILITDCTYMDDAYLKMHIGWGHSCVSEVINLAHAANVKKLCLFHHDPDQSDNDIDEKLKVAQQMLQNLESTTRCIAPKEGSQIVL